MKNNFWILTLLLILVSCSGDDSQVDDTDRPLKEYPAKIISPLNEEQYVIGDEVEVLIEVTEASKVSDLELYVDDTLYQRDIELKNQTIIIPTINGKVGWTKIRLAYKNEKGDNRSDTREIVFFSDLIPDYKTVKMEKTLPHLGSSYTQGLEFYDGKLFEGTGQWGTSLLAEVDLKTGKMLRSIPLKSDEFGEGITILNDTIYQLTWQNNICYVYDMEFNKLNEFTYSGEGWGLCNDGEFIIMSNGSAEVVWRNRQTFEIVKKIEVFDDDSSVDNLNELELIDGKLYANIYQQNDIAEIDTVTGKVMTFIDCSLLVRDALGGDVLNGIARNAIDGKIYMTGKYWSKLYEVTFE